MNNDLISREALKETIIKICGKCSNNITEYDENHIPNGNCAIWHILNMIDNAPTVEPETKVVANVTFNKEQLEEIVEKAKADILAQIERPQGEWIPVCEKLPEASRWYLVYTKYDDVMTDFFMDDGFMKGDDIIAWQPLPEPYKAGGKEE